MFGLNKSKKNNIDVSDASELIKNNTNNTEFIILDVRSPEEYAEGHIKGAVNVNYNGHDFEKEIELLDKKHAYLVCCRSGRRSSNAVKLMNKMGFNDVKNLSGGIQKWSKKGLPTE